MAYCKASKEERRNLKFFKPNPIEWLIDKEAIDVAKKEGLADKPAYTNGCMSIELSQKISYYKLKLRTDWVLSQWSQHGYWHR